MGGIRKPSAIHEVLGSYTRNPGRKRKNEPAPRMGIGDFPENASADPAECWREICSHICPGVLGNSDRFAVEIAARCLAEYRSAPELYPAAKLKILESMLTRLGMTPADRSRVVAYQAEGESDPADAYFT